MPSLTKSSTKRSSRKDPNDPGLLDDTAELLEAQDAEAQDAGSDVDDLAFLGREFLTWLLWRVDTGEGTFGAGDDAADFVFGGKVRIGGLLGEATDLVIKGAAPAHSIEARAAIGAGRTLREAELRVTRGEREWKLTLLADTLDVRAAKLPELLTEEEDDRFLERITLVEELDAIIKMAFAAFLTGRTRPAWTKTTVPAIRDWVIGALEVSA